MGHFRHRDMGQVDIWGSQALVNVPETTAASYPLCLKCLSEPVGTLGWEVPVLDGDTSP